MTGGINVPRLGDNRVVTTSTELSCCHGSDRRVKKNNKIKCCSALERMVCICPRCMNALLSKWFPIPTGAAYNAYVSALVSPSSSWMLSHFTRQTLNETPGEILCLGRERERERAAGGDRASFSSKERERARRQQDGAAESNKQVKLFIHFI